jgi:curved DNA-binding protein CbpA
MLGNGRQDVDEAYEILGNPSKRQAYDAARKRDNGFGNYRQEEATGSDTDIAADWEVVSKYHPETEELRARLSKLSRSLAFTFQVLVLENKAGANASTIAAKIENEFLERYFGKNLEIHRFVRLALLEGRSDVAKEENRAVKVLGTPNDPYAFIRRVRDAMKYERKDQSDRTVGFVVLFSFIIAAILITLLIVLRR